MFSRFGSAIVVEPLRSVPFLEKVPTNPLCFLLYNNSLSEELTDVRMYLCTCI